MFQLRTDMRNSSFKKISVTESMFTFTKASKRTRVLGNSCSVLQSYSCLFFSLPPSLSLFSQCFPAGRHLNQTHSASPHTWIHTSKFVTLPPPPQPPPPQQQQSPKSSKNLSSSFTESFSAKQPGYPAQLAFRGCTLTTRPRHPLWWQVGNVKLWRKPDNKTEQPAHEH